jgi:maintenance of mitochondrial morphology protein 1
MLPNFTLDLKSTSLLGSRAKLADVPKLHELIDNQLRRALSRRGTFKLVLPGISNIEDVKRPERQFVPAFKN